MQRFNRVCVVQSFSCLASSSEEVAETRQEGTLDNAWRALLTEAESSAAVLQELETVLRTEIKDTLIQWKKQNYPRFLGRNKVAKKVASDFEKARK